MSTSTYVREGCTAKLVERGGNHCLVIHCARLTGRREGQFAVFDLSYKFNLELQSNKAGESYARIYGAAPAKNKDWYDVPGSGVANFVVNGLDAKYKAFIPRLRHPCL